MPRQTLSVALRVAVVSWLVPAMLGILVPHCAADVVVSEFMAVNVTTLADADGDFPDWIELHNSGGTGVDLGGWSLTDNEAQPGRWMFPATNLAAGARLVVFASGKNRRVPGQPLHTSFKLASDGEFLALVDPGGSVVSALGPVLPRQRSDISYGRVGDSATNEFLSVPTPGAANVSSIAEFVADTKFSHDRGFHEAGFNLVITCATPGATIYYTTNGSAPDSNNLQRLTYIAPIPIAGTTTLRARAEKPGARASDIDTHTYLFLRDIVAQSTNGAAPAGWPSSPVNGQVFDYGMDPDIVAVPPGAGTLSNDLRAIPSVSVVMDLDDLVDPSTGIYVNATENGSAWERPASIELLRPDAPRDGFQLNAGLRIRGNFSRSGGNPKHSFHVVCRDDHGPARLRYPLFGESGAATHERFDLRTAQDDSYALAGSRSATYLADPFSRDTQLALGQPGERGDWVHLYINGQYWGLYNTCERPDAGFAASYFGGNADDYDVLKASPEGDRGNMEVVDGDDGAWTRLWQAARAGFAGNAAYFKVQGRNADGSVNPAFENLLDVTNLVDYLLTVIYTGNIDGPIYLDLNTGTVNNYFTFRSRGNTGGFRFIAHDAELSLLDVNENRAGTSSLGSSGPGLMNPHYLASRLRANAEFKTLFADRVQAHFFNGGALTPAAAAARFSVRTNELHQAITGESARWGDFANNTRNAPITRSNWLNGVARLLQNYFPDRSAIVVEQLQAEGLFPVLIAPSFSMAPGEVAVGSAFTLSNANASGVTYYTLDGTDPRAIGGAVRGTALADDTPIVITRSRTVRARVKSGASWSPLVEATFRPAQDFSGLRISEIMYHPPAEGLISGDEFEFLELKNTGESMLDLGGLYFSGITFTFPNGTRLAPGAFFVLGRNAALLARRSSGLLPHGIYTGKLANDGERITLHSAGGGELLSVNFRDIAPWPAAADGHGFSIVPVDVPGDGDLDNGLSWRASASVGGSPAADDPAPSIPPVVINELLTHTDLPDLDAIEIFNPTGAPLNLGGWYLTDDRAVPRKFRIPDGTFIAPGGYWLFSEDDFGQGPAAFALDSTGEEVCLFSGTVGGTNLTGYSHSAGVGAAANGVSFGRVRNSGGEERFVALESLTLGATNSAPRIGPAVLNEVHYHPAPGDDTFVEIVNISGSPLDLFDAAHPTNTWRLAGVDFAFPSGVTLPAGGFALIVGTEPSAFRTKYSVPLTVPVMGPYRGALQNNGERLELQRPDSPNSNGVPFITVDTVRYGDRAPWPVAADGDGSSLQRLAAGAFGDDATNWFASGLTPGQTNRATLGPSISGQPLSQSAIPGSDVEFVVAALGDWLVYQWRFNSGPIPGATSAVLQLTNVTSADAGFYDAVVSDGNGSSTSQVATLTVECPFALVEESATIGAAGGAISAALVAPAGCAWTIAGVPAWMTTAATNASGGGEVLFNVAANPGPSIRSVTLAIGGLPFVVTQSAPDSVRPTVSVISPAAGARINDATVRVAGTAGDNVAVERVEVVVGSTNVFRRASGKTSWEAEATLVPGTNYLSVRAVDLNGNISTTNTRVVFRVLPAALALTTIGAGAVSGPTNGQSLEIGRAYTLEARPGSGSVFSNWTGSVTSTVPRLGFVMASNFAVTANFVPNPFAGVAGKYLGLFHDTNEILQETSGGFALSLTTRGTYSASLQGGAFRLSASGRFDLEGLATNSLDRPGTNALGVRWRVAFEGSDTLSGIASNGVWSAVLDGDRAVFSRTNPCGLAGRYTMAWPGLPGDGFVPGGSSFAMVNIDSNGTVRLVGSLADGSGWSHAGRVSRHGFWPLHTTLYGRRGSVFSWLEFTDRAADDFHGLLNWSKPPVPGTRLYPGGFVTNVVEAAGSRYTPPSGTNRILPIVDAELLLAGGNLLLARTNRFGLGLGSRTTNRGPDQLSLALTVSNGRFKGTVRPTNGAAIAFGGVVLQKATNGAGYFAGTNQSGSVSIREESR